MVYTEIKEVSGKKYYYRVKSVRKDGKITKERKYLGVDLEKKKLVDAEKEADKELMLLENFLKANGVTYTFYRSLGTPSDCTPHNLDCFFFGQSKLERDTDKKTFTNDNNWYKFNNNTTFLGFEGSSVVHEYMQDGLTFRVHPRNGHPNTILATKIAFDLAEFITNQGDL
jgi:fibronectin type 3 domain-containing protein